MDTSKTCYLVFDFDGTVTFPQRPAGRIPREHLEALRYAKSKGHRLVLSTGRSWGFLQKSPSYRKIPWDAIIVGGSDAYWQGKQLFAASMDPKDVMKIAKCAMLGHSYLTLEGQQLYLAMDFRHKYRPWFRRDLERNLDRVRRFLLEDRVTKMSVSPWRGDFSHLKCEFLLHGKTFGEFGPRGCDKGRALARMCSLQGIPLSQCIVFGDSLNDLSMFKTVKESVSMAHAPQALKEAASFTAKGRFGVAEGIYHYFGDKNALTSEEK